jgi:hypothetical protein
MSWIPDSLPFAPFIFLYLDPGTGSLVLQLLLAAIFTIPFMFKQGWRKVVGLFRRSLGKNRMCGKEADHSPESKPPQI